MSSPFKIMLPSAAFLALLVLFVPSITHAFSLQHASLKAIPQRANAIRDAFAASYAEYIKYADGFDELRPLTQKGATTLGGWGATIVDAAGTAHFMGLDSIVQSSIEKLKKVDYARTDSAEVSLFETNIRHLAGLISLYELTGKQHSQLIQQAEVVGKKLLKGWVEGHTLPYNTLHWNGDSPPKEDTVSIIAESGTLILEFSKLSQYTKNLTYHEYANKAMTTIFNSTPVFPGLYSQSIDPMNNRPADDYVTWGGGSDSFFEYEVKFAMMQGGNQVYSSAWEKAVASSIRHLVTTIEGYPNLVSLTDFSNSNGGNIYQFSHLGCFAPGNWILGAKALGNDEMLRYGLQLAEGCWNTYSQTATGIGPEVYTFIGQGNKTNDNSKVKDQAYFKQHGFDPTYKDYILRPEVIESLFYAYRLTGDTKWQDRSWQAFQSIQKYATARKGATKAFTSINDVTNATTDQLDISPSFLYAETLKYLYLTQSDPSVGDLDKYVYNTEAHPLEYMTPDGHSVALKPTCADLKSCLSGPTATTNGKPSSTKPQLKRAPAPYLSGLPNARSILAQGSDAEQVAEEVQDALEQLLGGVGFTKSKAGSLPAATKRRLEEEM